MKNRSRQLTVNEQTSIVLALTRDNKQLLAEEIQHAILFVVTDPQDAKLLDSMMKTPIGSVQHG